MFKHIIPVILLVLISACTNAHHSSGAAAPCPHCAQCECCKSGSCQCACCKGGMCKGKKDHSSSAVSADEECAMCAKAKAEAAHKAMKH